MQFKNYAKANCIFYVFDKILNAAISACKDYDIDLGHACIVKYYTYIIPVILTGKARMWI